MDLRVKCFVLFFIYFEHLSVAIINIGYAIFSFISLITFWFWFGNFWLMHESFSPYLFPAPLQLRLSERERDNRRIKNVNCDDQLTSTQLLYLCNECCAYATTNFTGRMYKIELLKLFVYCESVIILRYEHFTTWWFYKLQLAETLGEIFPAWSDLHCTRG